MFVGSQAMLQSDVATERRANTNTTCIEPPDSNTPYTATAFNRNSGHVRPLLRPPRSGVY
jgi:hypothetical protein